MLCGFVFWLLVEEDDEMFSITESDGLMSQRLLNRLTRRTAVCCGTVALFFCATNGFADDAALPLHVRIDRLLARKPLGPTAERCSDAEFLRRTSLNLTGTIPSAAAARQFLADKSSEKRSRLIALLLNAPEYLRQMTDFFDVMIAERRNDKRVNSAQWRKYLYDSVRSNKPYNQLAREILTGWHKDPSLRAAAKFYYDRSVEPNKLTRDVGRIFFGKDFQCAQCHDHPLIENYMQSDYYGLYAFVNRSYVYTDKKKKKAILAERAAGKVGFKSVFTKISDRTLPRLPGGAQLVAPVFAKGLQYNPAVNGSPALPKISRRALLAREATNGSNRAFNRNIVNRLWALMMGRGLVEPVDLHHPDNPPSHPELLDLLAKNFAQNAFNVKSFLREIAMTEIYQRSSEPPRQLRGAAKTVSTQVVALERLKQQMETAEKQSETAVLQLEKKIEPPKTAVAKVEDELAKADATIAAAEKKAVPAKKNIDRFTNLLAAKKTALKAVQSALKQTAAVAGKLPADKEIAAILTVFRKKSAQFAKEATALETSLKKAKSQAQPFADKVTAAQKNAEPIIARLNAARAKLSPVDQKLAAAIAEWKQNQTRANTAEKEIAYLKSIVELDVADKLLAKSRSKWEALAKKRPLLSAVVASLEKKLQPRIAAVTQLEQQKSAVEKMLSVAKTQFVQKQAVAATVSAASKQIEAVKTQLPQDKELAKAAQTLKAKAAEYAKNIIPAQKRLAARQSERAEVAAKIDAAKKAMQPDRDKLQSRKTDFENTSQQLAAMTKTTGAQTTAVNELRGKLAKQQPVRFTVRPLQPLTPEQFVWSLMNATGYAERVRQGETGLFKKKNPKIAVPPDPLQFSESNRQIERAVAVKMKGNVAIFVRLFGGGAGQPQNEFFATVDQTLFLSNGTSLRSWLSPSGSNLTARLLKLKQGRAIADELYLSVLTRRPTPEEIQDVTAYLLPRKKDKSAALQELAWALMTSAEFRFNH